MFLSFGGVFYDVRPQMLKKVLTTVVKMMSPYRKFELIRVNSPRFDIHIFNS